jgi:hypothetical protein
MGTIKSKSIIPDFPTPDSQRTTPDHSGVTGIDINAGFWGRAAVDRAIVLSLSTEIRYSNLNSYLYSGQ